MKIAVTGADGFIGQMLVKAPAREWEPRSWLSAL